jgi:hypothetical protein
MANKTYKRRRNDVKIDMFPRWLDVTMIICKWFILLTPFVMASVMTMFHSYESAWDNWLVTCVYLLSLSNLIHYLDN